MTPYSEPNYAMGIMSGYLTETSADESKNINTNSTTKWTFGLKRSRTEENHHDGNNARRRKEGDPEDDYKLAGWLSGADDNQHNQKPIWISDSGDDGRTTWLSGAEDVPFVLKKALGKNNQENNSSSIQSSAL